jgi:S-adenosylmethionine:tRNA ribosyltransferase-isomerase
MMSALELAGHETAYVTLHVGPGTFRPVQTDALEDHEMHEEAYDVPPATVDAAAEARARGRDVIAVGTTVARTLEAAAQEDGNLAAGAGETRLFIKPPYRVRLVDHLLTNFHLPRSTLLALVMALAGVDLTQRAYGEAIEERYRFYSYGDAMLIRGVSH